MPCPSHNYRLPSLHEHVRERCRDCAGMRRDRARAGNVVICSDQGGATIQHSHRCDWWHARGTLL